MTPLSLGGLPSAIVRVAAGLLPRALHPWGAAMQAELSGAARPGEALRFAIGCLGFALRARIGSCIPRRIVMMVDVLADGEGGSKMMNDALFGRPQRLAAICAIAAIGLGLAYMAVAGAPMRYLVMNASALAIGFAIVGVVASVARTGRLTTGPIVLALAVGLMVTSHFGAGVDGAVRWIAVGGLFIQSSLLTLPVMAICFARSPDRLSTIAMVVAAAALAIQTDRAMSGALAAGMAALALVRPSRHVIIALCASVGCFAVTLLRPDALPAMPFVDQILYSSFDVHPLAGIAVLGGAALMIAPAVAGYLTDADHRDTYVVFGAVWLAIIVAAALGNYPTPVVGYGGSAIIGYVVSLLGLPTRSSAAMRNRRDADIGVGNNGREHDQRLAPGLAGSLG